MHQNGFRHGTFKCLIYKKLLQLIVKIDMDNNNWEYQVHDITSDSLYTPYYRREYSKNSIVKELDKKINKVFREMTKKNIFEKRGR